MYTLTSTRQSVTIRDGTLTITDSQTNESYHMDILSPVISTSLDGRVLHLVFDQGFLRAELSMDRDGFLAISVMGDGDLTGSVRHPFSLSLRCSDRLLIPLGEGVSLRADDPCPHLCGIRQFNSRENTMNFFAALRGESWLLTAVLEGADAASDTYRDRESLLRSDILWLPELGRWAYPRTIRYLTGSGGVTGACKAYRQMAIERGLLVTLEDKAKTLPQLRKLSSAADVWLWHDDYEKLMYSSQEENVTIDSRDDICRIASEMKTLGVMNAIWGIFFEKDGDTVPFLRENLGYLTAKYDNYTDLPPDDIQEFIPKNRIAACDFTYRRMKDWPEGAATNESGSPLPAWELRGTDGKMHPQSKLCPRYIVRRMAEEIPGELRKYPYDCRFIDVLGVESYECRSEAHPVNRRDFMKLKNEALSNISSLGLVSGTEDGTEGIVPTLCYNEGMMSPVYFRYDYLQAGRNKARRYGEEACQFFKFLLLNPKYRVPLWELVFHDCVVSYWYWGDSTNCCPEAIYDRDLLNILYGTPPLYSFKTGDWVRLKPLIAGSYARTGEAAEKTGGREMLSFTYLTEDELVQQTVFDGGVTAIVNFSEQCYESGELKVNPRDYLILQEGC